jgi:hypothetical protein
MQMIRAGWVEHIFVEMYLEMSSRFGIDYAARNRRFGREYLLLGPQTAIESIQQHKPSSVSFWSILAGTVAFLVFMLWMILPALISHGRWTHP